MSSPQKISKPDLVPNIDNSEFETDSTEADIFLKNEIEESSAFEQIIEEICSGSKFLIPGYFGLAQFVQMCLIAPSIAYPVLNFVFMGYETPHTCAELDNATAHDQLEQHGMAGDPTAQLVYGKCSIDLVSNSSGTPTKNHSLPCINGYDYKGLKHISFVSEWDLVCEADTGLTELVQTLLMVGQLVGAVCMTTFADKFGRKPVVISSLALLSALGVGCSFAPNILVLICGRFFIGFFQQGVGLVCFALVMEGFPPKYRRHVGVLAGFNWNLTVATFALAAWLMKDNSWRDIQMLSGLVGLAVLLYPMFLSESTRWLIANKKYDDASKVLKRACKWNNKDFDLIKKIFDERIVNAPDLSIQEEKGEAKMKTYSLLDVLKNQTLRNNTFFISFSWITCAFTYYALVLNSSALAGDRHLNFFLMGVVDFIGDIFILTLLDRIGRRGLAIVFLFFTGVMLLTASLLTAYGSSELEGSLVTVTTILGKFGIGVVFSVMFIYTPEIYPTNLRTAGFGFCSSLARVGGMIAPYSKALTKVIVWGPGAVFTVMCFVAGVFFFKLPETKGRSLPTTVEDMEKWRRTSRDEEETEALDTPIDAYRKEETEALDMPIDAYKKEYLNAPM